MSASLLRSFPLGVLLATVGCAPSSPVRPPVPATTAACSTDAGGSGGTFCLSGTVSTTAFTAPIQVVTAYLYNVFPSGAATAYAQEPVALDGTWAFTDLPLGPHYYLQLAVSFQNVATPMSQIVGPLTAAQSGAPVVVQCKPVELDVLESHPAGAAMAVQWARAHVFDPASGSEILETAKVAITVNGASVPLPWDSDRNAYFFTFSPSVFAEPTYTMTTADPSLGPAPLSWQLVANPPQFDGLITSPANGGADAGPAAIAVDQPMVVAWTDMPADDVSVSLYDEINADAGSWQMTYPSDPTADTTLSPDAGSVTIPAASVSTAGTYLLNVAYSNSNCPVTASGCVSAGSIAAEFLTVGGTATDAGVDAP